MAAAFRLGSWGASASRHGGAAVAFAAYTLLAFLFFGLRLVIDPGRTYGGVGVDPEISIWSFGWWPHALLHGLNPIHTHAIWAPDGVDLAWTTVTPTLALAFAPLTLLAGPLASFDVAFVLMPALAATTAFLLCRRLTGRFWPSLTGGYLFGFSSYLVGQAQGHLHLTSVFLLPLLVLLILRHLDGELGGRDFALRFGTLLALQAGLSTEVAFTFTLELASALVLAVLLVPQVRRRALAAVPWAIGGYAIAGLIAAPLAWYLLTDFHSQPVNPVSPSFFSTDLANLVVPSNLAAVSNGWAHSIFARFESGGLSESGSYLGVPALVVLVLFGAGGRGRPAVRWLLALFALTLLTACGAWLTIVGHRYFTLPWEHVGYLPLFKNVLTGRLSVYLALLTAVAVAAWSARSPAPRWLRVALPVLAVLAIAPDVHLRAWATTVAEPRFITDRLYRTCLERDENTAIFPFAGHGDSMLWQADAGYWFRMTGGYVAPSPPESFRQPLAVGGIAVYGELPKGRVDLAREFVRLKQVSAVVVDERYRAPWLSALDGLGRPERVGGVLLWRLGGDGISRRTSSRCRTTPAAPA